MILNKQILGACLVASKDENKPALSSVLIKDNHAIATDGYRLIDIELPKLNPKELPNMGIYEDMAEALLDSQGLKKALTKIPKKTELPILENTWTVKGTMENTVNFVSTDLDTIENTTVKTRDVKEYPHYEKIIPVQGDNLKAKVTVSVELMINQLQAFLKAGADLVTLEIREPLNPIGMYAKNSPETKISGLLMPVRTTD